MVELKKVSKTYGKGKERLKALSDVSLKLYEGEILGVIGSSGAGKSTLIRCVNLIERPDEGTVFINDIDITALSGRNLEQQRKKIGMIFQHFHLLSSRTIFDNVALPLELAGKSKEDIHKKVQELLELVGIADKARQYPAHLSGGQKQRVAIARALANDPYVLLCDEATSALDPLTTKAILDLLKRINERLKITILLITHEMDVVKSICHSVAIIDKGVLLVKGKTADVFSDYKNPIVSKFLSANDVVELPEIIVNRVSDQLFEGGFPIVEIRMEGREPSALISDLTSMYGLRIKVLKAVVDSFGIHTKGYLLVQFLGEFQQNQEAINYLKENNINIKLRGYV